MRAWIRFTARLYPPAWRERYGAEFDALLEDANVRWRDLPDVLWTALEIHMKTWGFRRLAAAGGLAGAVFAAAVAFRMPDQYASKAVLGYTGVESALAEPVHQALNGPFLAELSRKLELYPAEQQRMTGDDLFTKCGTTSSW